jgi:hypothetical protein
MNGNQTGRESGAAYESPVQDSSETLMFLVKGSGIETTVLRHLTSEKTDPPVRRAFAFIGDLQVWAMSYRQEHK